MRRINLLEPFDIAHSIHFIEGISIPINILPRQYIDGTLRIDKKVRCKIEYGPLENKGGHGNITKAKRFPFIQNICVKSPHNPTYSLLPEAILQWYASETLRSAGVYGSIPHVYDIFQYAGETRFSMEFIDGISAVKALESVVDPDTLLLQILAQVSFILGYLE